MIKILFSMMMTLTVLALSSCSNSGSEPIYINAEDKNDSIKNQGYDEQYRPLIHYSPARNWMNDPNGLIYANGLYHMYYQYNPYGNDWGNMSWGHAISKDLIHWEEKYEAITRNRWGDIFSGSAVLDADNTAGFGPGSIVAIYTANGARQQQCIAYSTDGQTFEQFQLNPVIGNTSNIGFRDPKVFWFEENKQWIMTIAKSDEHKIEFWGSSNLKNWTRLGEFSTPINDCNRGQWECPDLLRMSYNGQEKWVLIVSVNPGGPIVGSGTQYFVGQFDGSRFIADSLQYPMWIDYGMDNYAGVTWHNTGKRYLFIGWMNNWEYAGNVPVKPWRSAMTLPRQLRLISYQGRPLLASTVVDEIESIADDWENLEQHKIDGPYQLNVVFDLTENATIVLSNDEQQSYRINIDSNNKTLIGSRTSVSGRTDFGRNFDQPILRSPLNTEGNLVELNIFVDQSSVEVFTSNGSMAQTNLVFPSSIYNHIHLTGKVNSSKVRKLKNIWK